MELSMPNIMFGMTYESNTLNQVLKSGFYYGSDGFVFVLNHEDYPNIVWQTMFSWQGTISVKVRRTDDGGSTWTGWSEFVNS